MFAFPTLRFSAIFAILGLAACAGQNAAPPVNATNAAVPALASAAVTIGASPAKLNFTTKPSMKLTISEAKYAGTFTISTNPMGVVKVPKSAKGPKATITVKALNAGKTTIVVTDASKNRKTVPVTVTQGVIIIQ